jgi:hypothetical protein
MDIIEELIRQKPHLEDPLRFYAKAVRFMDAVKELQLPSRPDLTASPAEFTDQIVQRLLSVFDFPEGNLSPLKQALELVGDGRNGDDSDDGVPAVNGKRSHRCIEYSSAERKNTFS